MPHLRSKHRHRAGWENAPAQPLCDALNPHSSRRGAGLFGHKMNNDLQDSSRETCPSREGGNGREEPTSYLHIRMLAIWLNRSDVPRVGWWNDFWGHQVGFSGFGGRGFDIHGCFLFGFPVAVLGPAVVLVWGFRCLAVFLVAVTLEAQTPLWSAEDRNWFECGVLDGTTPSENVIPTLAQIYLLGRGSRPMSYRSGRLVGCDALSTTLGRRFHFTQPRYFYVWFYPASTETRLLPRGWTSTGELGSPTHRTHRDAGP